MLFPQELWVPSAKDRGSLIADVLVVANDSTQNLAAIGLDFLVPDDKVFILTAWAFSATRGGIVTITNVNVALNREDTVGSTRLYFRNQPAGTTEVQDDRQGEWWCPQGSRLRFTANFSAADPGNSVRFDFFAIQIPRGQLGSVVTER